MFNRREILRILAATGIGTAVFHRAVAAIATEKVTLENLQSAAWIAQLNLSEEEYESILDGVNRQNLQLTRLRDTKIDVQVAPAFEFKTLATHDKAPKINRNIRIQDNDETNLPEENEEIAFLPVTKLSELIRTRKLSSERLTQIYLDRLKKFGPMLRCVVTLTEELALQQAKQADKEIAAGNYRSPLHGIPWGAKDLVSVPEYPTTWGIPHFKDRIIEEKATVYQRLESAGAVLVAKLSMGAIAMGDLWFNGRTRNPWNPQKGSSGSSAGSASASAAGLVGFSIGTETLGSITTPSRICGATGFRPTFGRVSRHGCMPLSWTMDKVGPICRSAQDCAIVFSLIHGADEKDTTTYDASFDFDSRFDPSDLKIGYTTGKDLDEAPEYQILKELGCEFVKIKMPSSAIAQTLATVINVEAAAGFDYLLRDGHNEGWNQWTEIFQKANFVSAVDYVRMMRLRTMLMKEMKTLMTSVDFLFNVFEVFHTNHTGQPSIVLPRAIESSGEHQFQPKTVTITGRLNDDARLLQLASRYQEAIGSIEQRPALEYWLSKFEAGELDPKKEEDGSPAAPENQSSKSESKSATGGGD